MQRQVKSASRAFELIELFARVRAPMRLKDIAIGLGHPVSSTAALLKTLASQDYLVFNTRERSYMLTARMPHLVGWVAFEEFEDGIVAGVMAELKAKLNLGVVLASPVGIHLEYVKSLRAASGVQYSLPPGTRRLLIHTKTGLCFLARCPPSEAIFIYERTISSGGVDPKTLSLNKFKRLLEDHQSGGVHFSRARDLAIKTAHWNGAVLSTLIEVPPGHRPLALGVAGPTDELESRCQEITRSLDVAARQVKSDASG